MLAGLQFYRNSCLALAVVEMLLVGGDDLSGGDEVGVDEDVEMSGAVVDFAGGFDDEAGSRHHDLEGRGDGRAVGGLFKAD